MSLETLGRAAIAGLLPEPALTVSQWADQCRVLTQRESPEPGPWRTARVPYMREIMDCLSPSSSLLRVVFMKGVQVAATSSGMNWLGFIIDHAPGPALAVWPTVDSAKKQSKQIVAPMIEGSPTLRNKVKDARARDSGNTVLLKEFHGGVLAMTGANSATGLRSMPARYIFCDEIDRFPGDVEGEGDPVALAEARASNQPRRKIYLVSTPTIAGRSRIEREYLKSDQRRYFVPCPVCGLFQVLKFAQLKWPKDEPTKARYHCEGCDAALGDEHKTEMLARGEWRPTSTGDGQTAGFHLSSLYSPVGWVSWPALAQQWKAAQGNQEEIKAFLNTRLGECWQARGDAPDWDYVYRQRGAYRSGTVPQGVSVLFAGVDVQKDRLEVGVWGFGRHRQRWLIEHRQLIGATHRPEVWSGLEGMLDDTWPHENGSEVPVMDWGVDAGAFGAEVGAFVRRHRGRGNVHAVDGMDRYQSAFLGIGGMDVTVDGKKIPKGLKTLRIGVSFCKQELVGALALGRESPPPPGFVHLPSDVTEDQCKQLTSESLQTRTVGGRIKREWVLDPARRNEVLDCANYARGLAHMRGWDRSRDMHFDGLEAQLEPPPTEEAPPTPIMHRPRPDRKSGRVRSSSWMS
jgi:phage terminase large subunit GpA-like protein